MKLKAIAKRFGDGKPPLNPLHCQRGRSRGLEKGLADGSVQVRRKYINKQRLGRTKCSIATAEIKNRRIWAEGKKSGSILRGKGSLKLKAEAG